ncbi:MAG TPA: patatin-like phospholipase family protein [Gammaproteobacteria bacterium]|nr:patatin-like phospholipase family protein [Gammaproteobacteria bacterium]
MAGGIRKALILPGAGARGAYQIGVLKAVAELLPADAPCPFSVLSGTSAGAINAAVLASRAGSFVTAVRDMEQVWSGFSVDQVYRADVLAMLKASLHWFATIVLGGLGKHNPVSLLDSSPLEELLQKHIRFPGIDRAIRRGQIEALAVTASAYTSSRSVTFYQCHGDAPSWRRTRRIGRPTMVRVEHLMASTAVPFIFPAIRIGTEYYGDGSMRHRAPLSAAIHLGADRLLVVSVRDEHPDPEPTPGDEPGAPSLAHLAGYMLDSLFMDGLYGDLERITRINMILEQLGTGGLRGPIANLRRIDSMIVLPSEDIRNVAGRHAHELPLPVRLLLKGLGATSRDGRQLISYLLFESGFTRELIDMGYKDGLAKRDELEAFLFDESMDSLEAPPYLRADLEH